MKSGGIFILVSLREMMGSAMKQRSRVPFRDNIILEMKEFIESKNRGLTDDQSVDT